MQEKNLAGLDKFENGDIIDKNSASDITQITDEAISKVPEVEISSYSDEQNAYIQQQHKELLEFARDKNGSKEVAFVFNEDLTERKEFLGESDKLDFGSALYGKDLLVMHNHPRNSSFSTMDIAFFTRDNVKTLTVVKNNGAIETLTKSENYNVDTFLIEYKRLYKKIVKIGANAEKDKFVKALLSKTKAGVIWSEKV